MAASSVDDLISLASTSTVAEDVARPQFEPAPRWLIIFRIQVKYLTLEKLPPVEVPIMRSDLEYYSVDVLKVMVQEHFQRNHQICLCRRKFALFAYMISAVSWQKMPCQWKLSEFFHIEHPAFDVERNVYNCHARLVQ